MSPRLFALCSLVTIVAGYCGINSATKQLIQGFETFLPSPKADGYGHYAIGYGHDCIPNGPKCSDICGSQYTCPISEPQAQQLFSRDIAHFESCTTNALRVCLNDNQYGALVSLNFNTGCPTSKSTLFNRLNNGEDPDTVARQLFPTYDKSEGKVSKGLQRRRAAELNLFTTDSGNGGNCQCGGAAPGGPPASAPYSPAPNPGGSPSAPSANPPPGNAPYPNAPYPGQPPYGQPPTGQPPTGQPPTGQPPTGQPPTGQPPTGQPPTGQPPAPYPPAGSPS